MAVENTRSSGGCLPVMDDPGNQYIRSANISIPPVIDIDQYVMSATFVTEDTNDVNQHKPFFPCVSERNPEIHGITVVATRRREIQASTSANTS